MSTTHQLIALINVLLIAVAHAGCPDLLSMRSSSVNSSFDPTQLTGFWYEQAFADIAQVGASCPTLNSTKGDNEVVTMDLKVKYGPIPFTITELYTPKGGAGVYNKNAKMPGGSLLNLATVVVDVQPTYMVLFSCIDVAVTHVTEVVVATRHRKPKESEIDSILSIAHSLGVPFTDAGLTRVDWDKCSADEVSPL